jgi:cytochrome P450
MSYSIFKIAISIITVLLTYFLYTKIIYPYYLSPLRNLPRHPNAIKHWFKNLQHTLAGRLDINLQLIQAYGPVVHVEDNFVIVQDNDFRKIYLTYKFKKDPIYSLLDVNGPNLFSTMDKGFHVSRRRLISPAFSLKNLQKMEPTIYRVGSDSLIKYIESKLVDNKVEEIDLFQLFHSNTMDVITCLIFGTSLNTTWDREKAQYYNKIIEKTQKQIFFRLILPFYKFVKLSMETLFKPMILDNIRKRRESNEVHYDILQSLIDSKDPENGEGMKDLEIVDECLVLLFGGMDTTANTMTWTLYEILKHPDIYNQVTSEILEKFPNLNEPITVEKAKSELKHLEACILESMRKNPVASGGIVRTVPESGITVSGHYLPPGVSNYKLHKYNLLINLTLDLCWVRYLRSTKRPFNLEITRNI